MKSAVFDRNGTSESSGSIGFGLYFVHVMMTQYGGNIRFEDALKHLTIRQRMG